MKTLFICLIELMNCQLSWSSGAIKCGGRFNQPPQQFQFYSAPPTTDNLDELIARVDFYAVPEGKTIIERFGPERG